MKVKHSRKTKTKTKKNRQKLSRMEKSAEVAYYYGFTRGSDLKIEKEDFDIARNALDIKEEKNAPKNGLMVFAEEKVALLRHYLETNPNPQGQPLMLYYEGSSGGRISKTFGEKKFYLDIIGTPKSIAEAVLIKTALEILKEEGFENLLVEINTLGDRESMASFMRDVTNYYKKNLNDLPAHCRQIFKGDPFEVLLCQNEKCQVLKEAAPRPIGSLSESSRKHFGEVLEYLETLKIPYKINSDLLHSRKLCLGTIFSIKDATSNAPLAVGLRYNGLSKKIGFKKEWGAVGIFGRYKKNKSASKKNAKRAVRSPKIYFIQLGFEAKLKSLEIIEILRKAKIPLMQGLIKDRLAPQLQVAENMNIPYTIIMGQKEAMENSVIVRDMNSREQETVPIPKLAEYLKKIRM